MPLPAELQRVVDKELSEYCKNKIPERVAGELRLSFTTERTTVTPFEERPRFDRPLEWTSIPVARFRYNLGTGLWTLLWPDRNSKWHTYSDLPPAKTLRPLLRVVDKDPTGIFWG